MSFPSNIKTVYALVNGQKVIATYDESTELYTIQATAPAESSWNQENHVYQVSLHAEDAASNTVSMDSSDSTYGSQLQIRVLEKTKPTATITSPTTGSVLGSSTQTIGLKIVDAGGSGLNMSTVVFKVNGTTIANSSLTWTDADDGSKTATYSATNLSDGSNNVSLAVTDNDGNVSDTATVTFTISTAAPSLSITSPTENLLTNAATVTVSGVATAGTSYVSVTSVTVNGGAVTIGSDGSFSTTVGLTEGENTITIIATDTVGKTTTVTRIVTADFTAPVISNVVAAATTVDASGTIKITFKVIEA